MTETSRLQWVDAAKGISIILVVMMYAAHGVGEDTGGIGVLHWIIGFSTPFRMPEFFLVSGLFLSQVIARPWGRYADRRALHYFYFYALWAFIHIAVKAMVAGDPAGGLAILASAVVQPYGVLWFIYMLGVFSLVAKLLFTLRVPHWATIAVAAGLQMAPIASASYAVTQFAEYFVYFYLAYAAAPLIFSFANWVERHPLGAAAGLGAWALVNGALVFSPGYEIMPLDMRMGLAALPGLHLALAIAGALAVCAAAVLLARFASMGWLVWIGARSLVIYLAFALPMTATRLVALKTGFVTDPNALSLLTFSVALASPLLLHALILRTGRGRFLFERPAWARTGRHASANPSVASVAAE